MFHKPELILALARPTTMDLVALAIGTRWLKVPFRMPYWNDYRRMVDILG